MPLLRPLAGPRRVPFDLSCTVCFVQVVFGGHVQAKCVRIFPQSWYGHMSMRAGVLIKASGCTKSNPADGQRTYSSVWSNEASGVGHGRGTLDSPQAWSSLHNTVGQYMQMNVGALTGVCGVVVQGRQDCCDQWVTSFKVQVSRDCAAFTDVDNGNVFAGNWDRVSQLEVAHPPRSISPPGLSTVPIRTSSLQACAANERSEGTHHA